MKITNLEVKNLYPLAGLTDLGYSAVVSWMDKRDAQPAAGVNTTPLPSDSCVETTLTCQSQPVCPLPLFTAEVRPLPRLECPWTIDVPFSWREGDTALPGLLEKCLAREDSLVGWQKRPFKCKHETKFSV